MFNSFLHLFQTTLFQNDNKNIYLQKITFNTLTIQIFHITKLDKPNDFPNSIITFYACSKQLH